MRLFDSGVIPSGQHTLYIRNMLDNGFFYVDRFEVFPNVPEPEPEPTTQTTQRAPAEAGQSTRTDTSTTATTAAQNTGIQSHTSDGSLSDGLATREGTREVTRTVTGAAASESTPSISAHTDAASSPSQRGFGTPIQRTDGTPESTDAAGTQSKDPTSLAEGSSKRFPVGPVIGGILGVLTVAVLLALFLLLYRRRRRQKRQRGLDHSGFTEMPWGDGKAVVLPTASVSRSAPSRGEDSDELGDGSIRPYDLHTGSIAPALYSKEKADARKPGAFQQLSISTSRSSSGDTMARRGLERGDSLREPPPYQTWKPEA